MVLPILIIYTSLLKVIAGWGVCLHIGFIIVAAWQEIYDENTGYVYYWNVETNAVTWEMPPEYQAYIASTTQAHAQQWMMEQSMAMMPVMATHPQMMAHTAMSKYKCLLHVV